MEEEDNFRLSKMSDGSMNEDQVFTVSPLSQARHNDRDNFGNRESGGLRGSMQAISTATIQASARMRQSAMQVAHEAHTHNQLVKSVPSILHV